MVYNNLLYSLDGTRLRVGRSQQSDVIIKGDFMVSSSHFLIHNGELLDERSTNGTYLNGVLAEKNKRYPLKVGDQILIGNTKISIVDDDYVVGPVASSAGNAAPSTVAENPMLAASFEAKTVELPSMSQSKDDEDDDVIIHDGLDNVSYTFDDDDDVVEDDPKLVGPSLLPVVNMPAQTAEELAQLSLEQQVQELRTRLQNSEANRQYYERQMNHYKRKINVQQHKAKFQKFEAKVSNLEFQLLYGDSQKDKEMDDLKKQMKQMLRDFATEKADMEHVIMSLRGEVKTAVEEAEQLKKKVEDLTKDLREKTHETGSLRMQLEDTKAELRQAYASVRKLEVRLSSQSQGGSTNPKVEEEPVSSELRSHSEEEVLTELVGVTQRLDHIQKTLDGFGKSLSETSKRPKSWIDGKGAIVASLILAGALAVPRLLGFFQTSPQI